MTTTTAKIHRLQAAYHKYQMLDAAVDAICDELDCATQGGCSMETVDALDHEFDEAYAAYTVALERVIDGLTELCMIDRKTARAMIHRYPERLERLMSATVVDAAGREA